MHLEVFKATEQELQVRRNGLVEAGNLLLTSQPDILAIVYVGSVLFRLYEGEGHFDTDYFILTQPRFVHTTEEVNVMMGQWLAVASEKHRVNLPYSDALDVVKVSQEHNPVKLGPFPMDFGNLVVGRNSIYFEPPARREYLLIEEY